MKMGTQEGGICVQGPWKYGPRWNGGFILKPRGRKHWRLSLHLAEYGVSGQKSLEFCSGHRNPLKVIKQEKKRGHAKSTTLAGLLW